MTTYGDFRQEFPLPKTIVIEDGLGDNTYAHIRELQCNDLHYILEEKQDAPCTFFS